MSYRGPEIKYNFNDCAGNKSDAFQNGETNFDKEINYDSAYKRGEFVDENYDPKIVGNTRPPEYKNNPFLNINDNMDTFQNINSIQNFQHSFQDFTISRQTEKTLDQKNVNIIFGNGKASFDHLKYPSFNIVPYETMLSTFFLYENIKNIKLPKDNKKNVFLKLNLKHNKIITIVKKDKLRKTPEKDIRKIKFDKQNIKETGIICVKRKRQYTKIKDLSFEKQVDHNRKQNNKKCKNYYQNNKEKILQKRKSKYNQKIGVNEML